MPPSCAGIFGLQTGRGALRLPVRSPARQAARHRSRCSSLSSPLRRDRPPRPACLRLAAHRFVTDWKISEPSCNGDLRCSGCCGSAAAAAPRRFRRLAAPLATVVSVLAIGTRARRFGRKLGRQIELGRRRLRRAVRRSVERRPRSGHRRMGRLRRRVVGGAEEASGVAGAAGARSAAGRASATTSLPLEMTRAVRADGNRLHALGFRKRRGRRRRRIGRADRSSAPRCFAPVQRRRTGAAGAGEAETAAAGVAEAAADGPMRPTNRRAEPPRDRSRHRRRRGTGCAFACCCRSTGCSSLETSLTGSGLPFWSLSSTEAESLGEATVSCGRRLNLGRTVRRHDQRRRLGQARRALDDPGADEAGGADDDQNAHRQRQHVCRNGAALHRPAAAASPSPAADRSTLPYQNAAESKSSARCEIQGAAQNRRARPQSARSAIVAWRRSRAPRRLASSI